MTRTLTISLPSYSPLLFLSPPVTIPELYLSLDTATMKRALSTAASMGEEGMVVVQVQGMMTTPLTTTALTITTTIIIIISTMTIIMSWSSQTKILSG